MGCINRAYLESSAHSFEMQLQKQEMSLSLEVVKKLKVIRTNFILNRDTLIFININGSNKESTCSKSSSWLGLTDPLWDTGKKENIFSAEEFSLSCFCLSHNKFEKHSLLWPVTIIQFPLHALNSPSMKPNFPVAFHRESEIQVSIRACHIPSRRGRQIISVSKSHNCNWQPSVLATACSHHFTLPITLGGCGAPNNYLLLAVLHCSVKCESSFEAEAKTLNTH